MDISLDNFVVSSPTLLPCQAKLPTLQSYRRPVLWQVAMLVYQPLAHTRDIRVAHILPGVDSDTLRLELHHRSLDDTSLSPFEALSYTWGSPENPETAHVVSVTADVPDTTDKDASKGKHGLIAIPVPIGRNLADALRNLRRPDLVRIVWADALCINQNDIPERNRQVAMMASVYHCAGRVVAFLGPKNEECMRAMALLDDIAGRVTVDWSTGLVSPSSSGVDEDEAEHLRWFDVNAPLPLMPRSLRDLLAILRHAWFERLWVRQEIGIGGSNAVLMCGQVEISWMSFCASVFVVNKKPLQRPTMLVRGEAELASDELQELRARLEVVEEIISTAQRGFKFGGLRRRTRHARCFDPRDRIYGLLSRLGDAEAMGVVPDYARSSRDVYIDVTMRHIRFTKGLDILTQAEKTVPVNLEEVEETSTLALPSWVPNFTVPLLTENIHSVQPPFYKSLTAFSHADDVSVSAYGVRCGRVVHVEHIEIPKTQPGPDWLPGIRRLFGIIYNILHDRVLRLDMYPSGETLRDAFYRTLVGDNFMEKWLPLKPEEPPYQECMEFMDTVLRTDYIEPLGGRDAHKIDNTQQINRDEDVRACSMPSALRYLQEFRYIASHRSLVVTDHGHIGLAPRPTRPGDELVDLCGTFRPTILRRHQNNGDNGRYEVVGETYAHGFMTGEAVLGYLGPHLRQVTDRDTRVRTTVAGYVDWRDRDVFSRQDSREEVLLGRLVEMGLISEANMETLEAAGASEVLVKAGIPLEVFVLR